MDNIIKSLAVAAVTAAAVAVPSVAHAERAPIDNTPGCISTKEWRRVPFDTMSPMEAQLQVKGQGEVILYLDDGKNLTKQYRWCGHGARDYALINYKGNGRRFDAEMIILFDWTGRSVTRVQS